MVGISQTLIYLLVVLLDVVPAEEMVVDYLQNSTPAMQLEISQVDRNDPDVHVITVAGSPQARLEKSDLYAHLYVAYPVDGAPFVVDLTEARRQLRLPLRPPSASGDTPAYQTMTAEQGGEVATGTIHLFQRPPVTILSAETDQIVLVAW